MCRPIRNFISYSLAVLEPPLGSSTVGRSRHGRLDIPARKIFHELPGTEVKNLPAAPTGRRDIERTGSSGVRANLPAEDA
jgi:hypothetical protein